MTGICGAPLQERRQEYCGKLPSCVSYSNWLQGDGAHTPLKIMEHLEEHSILTPAQDGFLTKRSCETQLIATIHELAN